MDNIINLKDILTESERERFKLKHPYVGSEHLFLAMLKSKNELSSYLKKYNVTYSTFKNELINVVGHCTKDNPSNLYTPLLRKIIKRYESKNNTSSDITIPLFISILDEGEGIAIRILLKMNIDLDEIYFKLKENTKINEMEVSSKIGILLNNSVNKEERVIGRDEEINKIILTLTRKKKCNPILLGNAGVGKSAIVEELTRRIIKGLVPEKLKNNKVIMIEMGSLISGTKYRGEFEERLNNLIREVINNKKTILFIDEIHTMIGAGGAEGAINAGDILKPYLARGDIKCIGATTEKEYNNSILKDKALARRFDVINVNEPNKEEMKELLYGIKKEYEQFHGIKISNSSLDEIVELSDCYLKNLSNPDKSIDLLDSSCAYAKMNNKLVLRKEDIIKTISYKTNNSLIGNNMVFEIKELFKDYVSENDIKSICNIFHFDMKRPISILLSDSLLLEKFKSILGNINTIEIDLKEYFQPGMSFFNDKNIEDTIFSSMIEKPYSLIVIKNIDQASKIIQNEIEKINKDGYIQFKHNEKLYFNSAVVIGITNEIKELRGFDKSLSTSISKNLIDLFSSDIRSIKVKELTY